MDLLIGMLLAFGLAMDAFAVSVVGGLTVRPLGIGDALRAPAFFGFFQGVMPVVGWLAGHKLENLVLGFGHWIAFGLLSAIGFKMIYESAGQKQNYLIDLLDVRILLMLSIVTSIDALVAGLTISILGAPILRHATMISVVTFLLSLFGVFVGNKLGFFLGDKTGVVGGVILILVGFQTLVKHI